jgi:hypothetical protein
MALRRTPTKGAPDSPLPTLAPPEAIVTLRVNQQVVKRKVEWLWEETTRLTGLRMQTQPRPSQQTDTELAAELREVMEQRQLAQKALTDMQEEERAWIDSESGPFIHALHNEHYIVELMPFKESLIESSKRQERCFRIIKHGMEQTRGRYPAPRMHLMPGGLQDTIARIEKYLEQQQKGCA